MLPYYHHVAVQLLVYTKGLGVSPGYFGLKMLIPTKASPFLQSLIPAETAVKQYLAEEKLAAALPSSS
ncbi:hypothetical protein EVAR_81201_1 [Eumeta japonica]|uniref:Uncharacterized protein n=1 Tax=Eumeta variegata TaxID=151549 RepID=A0A4C1V2S1_EUMVA|nr:hypothetical protein EVAR_81201_1 [Eumeta japonica]